jgi:hypothetical protein
MRLIRLTFPDQEDKWSAGKALTGKAMPNSFQCFQAKVSGQTLRVAAQLGVISMFLGLLAVVLGVVSIFH